MIKFLKKIFLFGIISLGIINFSNAGSIVKTGHYEATIGSVGNSNYAFYIGVNGLSEDISFDYDCSISNFVNSGYEIKSFSKFGFQLSFLLAGTTSNNGTFSYSTRNFLNNVLSSSNLFNDFTEAGTVVISNGDISLSSYSSRDFINYYALGFYPLSSASCSLGTSSTGCNMSFDYSCSLSGDIFYSSSCGGSSSCDYSDYELKSDITQSYCTSNNLCPSCQSCDYSDYELKSDITENYCTNKFSSLINEEDITSGYCETEFGLIDPEDCPASGGTGDINWSNFFVNSEQIQGASMVYLRLPEFLNWDYTYINSGSTLNINVENVGDSEYIQNILDIQSYHPDKDQFAFSFAGFLTLLMPYIIITLFVLFIWRLIRRIFK